MGNDLIGEYIGLDGKFNSNKFDDDVAKISLINPVFSNFLELLGKKYTKKNDHQLQVKNDKELLIRNFVNECIRYEQCEISFDDKEQELHYINGSIPRFQLIMSYLPPQTQKALFYSIQYAIKNGGYTTFTKLKKDGFFEEKSLTSILSQMIKKQLIYKNKPGKETHYYPWKLMIDILKLKENL